VFVVYSFVICLFGAIVSALRVFFVLLACLLDILYVISEQINDDDDDDEDRPQVMELCRDSA